MRIFYSGGDPEKCVKLRFNGEISITQKKLARVKKGKEIAFMWRKNWNYCR